MIITQESSEVTTNIRRADRAVFGVKIDGKLFGILTKNLYSNPVLGALQELGQNAFDSHLMAKKGDVPFKVTLPNYFNPTLIVRDFGVGMTHDFMMERYATALESTKDTDANQAGGFGIGKLICLALSTTYSVACFENGKRRSYSVFLNGDGMPEIIHTNTRDTDEENGVEVSVPIQPKDLAAFPDAARRAYKYYSPQPTIDGISNFTFTSIDKSLSGTDWWIDRSINFPVAIGGIYWYRIEPRDIPNLTEKQIKMLSSNSGITMRFGSSEITPQTNRQGLNYDDKTVAAIKAKLVQIESEAMSVIQKHFDSCQSILEAKLLYSRYFNYGGEAYQLGSLISTRINPTVKWRTYTIEDTNLINEDVFNGVKRAIPGVSMKTIGLNYRRGRYSAFESVESRYSYRKLSKIFINDLDGGRGAKFRAGYTMRVDANSNSGVGSARYLILRFDNDLAQKEFDRINGTDSSTFTKLSSIIVPRDANFTTDGTNEKHKLKVFKYIGYRHGSASNNWEAAEIDMDEGGVYLPIHRFQAFGFDNSEIAEKIKVLKKYSLYNDTVIYGIKDSGEGSEMLSEIRKSDDWISFGNWITEQAQAIQIDSNAYQSIVDAKETRSIRFRHFDPKSFTHPAMLKFLSDMKFVIAQEAEAQKNNALLTDYRELTGKEFSSSIDLTPTVDLETEYQKLIKSYPLLRHYVSSYYNEAKEVEEYMQAVDCLNEKKSEKTLTAP